jgi:hypothetical protein
MSVVHFHIDQKKLPGWWYNGVVGFGDYMINVWGIEGYSQELGAQNKSAEELNFCGSVDCAKTIKKKLQLQRKSY